MPQQPGGVLATAWHRYQQSLRQEPLKTKAITAGVLAALSELIAQRLSGSKTTHWRRAGALGLYGLLFSGPANHYWQNLIQRLFGPKSDANTVTTKVIFDNLTFGPILNAAYMLFTAAVLEGMPWKLAQQRVRSMFLAVQLRGWTLWPLVSALNYTLIPIEKRVLVINVVALMWSVLLNMRSRSVLPAGKQQ